MSTFEEKWVIEFSKDVKTGEPRFSYTRYINGIQFGAYGFFRRVKH
jgi:predicted transcriptional regulator